MSTLIESMVEGVRRLNFSEKENLDFLNRCCAFWDLPEFRFNDLESSKTQSFDFYRIFPDGCLEFCKRPLDLFNEEDIYSFAAAAIDSIYGGDELVPSSLKRVYDIF